MARTQKNKATSGHLGLLKAKLAKLRRELITPKGGGGGGEQGFEVAKTGDARIGFVGVFFNNFISIILNIRSYDHIISIIDKSCNRKVYKNLYN